MEKQGAAFSAYIDSYKMRSRSENLFYIFSINRENIIICEKYACIKMRACISARACVRVSEYVNMDMLEQ